MTMRAAFVVAALAAPLPAQWLHYPTPGMPRTADGKPNLSAPTPRTADGKPDLSGIWALQRPLACAATGCVPPEFGNIAVSLKDGLPYQPWARDLAKNRRESLRMDDPISHCLPPGIVELETIAYKKIVQTPGLLQLARFAVWSRHRRGHLGHSASYGPKRHPALTWPECARGDGAERGNPGLRCERRRHKLKNHLPPRRRLLTSIS